ncbi:MAG: prepilin-type N-terminal cleavage/methylation domain-containing protein [FCB group bacterium]|nr:prepilin-type N-terminal cleavage/methylation domain-containing protein [FCB group bacterium]
MTLLCLDPPRLRGGRGGGISHRAGFTLLEVVIALAILATALLVLLESHFAALSLYDASRQETIERMLLRQAAGMAETDLMAGNASGSGDFGKRYPDYRFSYASTSMGEETTAGLYDVLVTLEGPGEKRELHVLVYYMGSGE